MSRGMPAFFSNNPARYGADTDAQAVRNGNE